MVNGSDYIEIQEGRQTPIEDRIDELSYKQEDQILARENE